MTTPYQQQGQAPVPPQTPPQAPPQPPQAYAHQQPQQAPQHQAPHVPPGYVSPPPGAPAQPYAAVGTYTSPIPIQRTHLGNAIASEWTKIKSVRSTIWTLSVMAALVVGIGFLTSASTNDSDYTSAPTTLPGFFGALLGQLCVVTLGVLVISSEYGTGMIRTTFTASPARSRVLTAKALVFFTLAFVTTTLSLALVTFISSGMHSGPKVMDPSNDQLIGATLGVGLYVSLLGLLSLAVGSMLRHSAGAITTMLGVVLLPSILPAFLMMSPSLADLGVTMQKYSSPFALAALFQIDDSMGSGWSQLGVLGGITAGALVAAYVLLEKRDV
ncbi:putative ABC transporter transmembrane protein [Streptomyces himastatinicus ATCC 53653]|uniref:Putative ABC transporter transmembrane protein n=1 Tax=Streptomyces himastatinicus ATCC 53653 TaxID=457427 RepID=D9WED2_9ACTN|nr:ABC transporter permease [Streptomyces himastatinicus]EFL23171.1 putative ABC transporter transmembrane protein [Streptomyces himastatinicus ATCC 53653]